MTTLVGIYVLTPKAVRSRLVLVLLSSTLIQR